MNKHRVVRFDPVVWEAPCLLFGQDAGRRAYPLRSFRFSNLDSLKGRGMVDIRPA